MKTINVELPAHWAPCLINGTTDNLSEKELEEINFFASHYGECFQVSEDTYFGTFMSIGQTLAIYTFAEKGPTTNCKDCGLLIHDDENHNCN